MGLAETEQWMLEVNLSNLGTTSGEREAYWLVAIKAARAQQDIIKGRLPILETFIP
jgi:hypothetical protein